MYLFKIKIVRMDINFYFLTTLVMTYLKLYYELSSYLVLIEESAKLTFFYLTTQTSHVHFQMSRFHYYFVREVLLNYLGYLVEFKLLELFYIHLVVFVHSIALLVFVFTLQTEKH